jgi:hypothetical protein
MCDGASIGRFRTLVEQTSNDELPCAQMLTSWPDQLYGGSFGGGGRVKYFYHHLTQSPRKVGTQWALPLKILRTRLSFLPSQV